MENRLASPFTLTFPSLTSPARTFRRTLQMQPANVIVVCVSLRLLSLRFSPPPPFEAQCIPFQCKGLEAAITSSHIWDVWAKPLCHQWYSFHFCLNYFWVFFFTFPSFFCLYANMGSWIQRFSALLHNRQWMLLFQMNACACMECVCNFWKWLSEVYR